MSYNIGDCVNRGADLLTKHFGGTSWVERIDFDVLRMHSPFECVLGQLFKTYSNGLEALGIDPDNGEDEAYGFEIDDSFSTYYTLELLWRNKIEGLRLAGLNPGGVL